MLSLANVSPQQGATYYKTENYYSKADAVGYSKWVGSGVEKNGLTGAVEHHTFTRLLAGKHPQIAVGGTKSNRRAGLDMTFSAPKSVSLQALVFGDTRLVEAHRKAVDEALRFTEAHYALHREGPREARVKALGKGFIVAQFEHDTSRLKDPQLHTHNVVLNRIETREGEVKALCADSIYTHGLLIGAVYRNALALEVKALGYGIRALPKGLFELDGMPERALEKFSKRRAQIEEMNPESYRQTRELVLKNRQAKEGPQLREDLIEGWQTEAHAAGVKPLHKARSQKTEVALPLEKVMQDALAHASLRSALFRREDFLRGALEIGLGKFSLSDIEKRFEDSIGREVLLSKVEGCFTSRAAVERDLEMRRMVNNDLGTFLPLASREATDARMARLAALDLPSARSALFESETSLKAIAAETPRFLAAREKFTGALKSGQRLTLEDITQTRSALLEDVKVMPKAQRKEAYAAALAVLAPLEKAFLAPTQGQRNAIETTLISSDRVIIWQGVAGAGKTFSMRQIVEEAARTGVEVRGLAPSAAAAVQLTSEAGIEATTLQSHLLRRETRSDKQKLWIVDEAGMVAAADMHKLLSKARDSNARVLLVGDTAQLLPIDAGIPFADLQKNTHTTCVRLDESLRQKDPELQKAVAHLNAGDAAKALETLQSSVHDYRSSRARSAAATRAFLESQGGSRDDTLLLARTNEIRADVTHRVREGLKKSGVLRNPILAETFQRIDVPESKQAYASQYLEGALLVPNRHYKSLGLEKDAPYEIMRVDSALNTLTVRRGDRQVSIDLKATNNFSMFGKATIEIAEGDRMIWNRNVRAKGQVNNRSFVIEKIASDGIHIHTDSNETRLLTTKERQHMEHAWALTIYKAQGRTSSAVIQVADGATDARDLLVGITRASNRVQVMGPAKETLLRAVTREDHKAVAAEVVLESNLQTLSASLPQGTEKVPERSRSRGRRL